MSRDRLRVALALAATLSLVLALAAAHGGARPGAPDPHGDPRLPRAEMHRLLAATRAAARSASSAELVAQGRALFDSTTLPRSGESCQSCHTVVAANAAVGTIMHPRPTTPNDFTGPRDPLPLYDVARTGPYLWSGNVATLEQQTINVIKGFFKDGATQPAETTAQQAAALLAFMGTIHHPVSERDLGTMSAAARRGEGIFRGKGNCVHCHLDNGLFTDRKVHDDNVPPVAGETDPGSAAHPGAFDTPTLRDVRNTAPYMHNGSLKTLKDVVDFYNTIGPNGNGLSLKPDEEADLIAFLEAL